VRSRGGFTVIEALTVLLLLLLVLQTGWTLTAGMGRAVTELADRGESLAASRATAWILQEELEGVVAPMDVSAPTGDSFSVRAFRGSAVVCSARPPAELVVRWSGVRSPDPTKDSVLVLETGGALSVRSLASRVATPGACGDLPGRAERWTLDAPMPRAVLMRFFERGSYHLTDDAFRYRIGAGGRQPLTPASIDPARSGLGAEAPARVVLELHTRGAHLGRAGPWVRRAFPVMGRW
jgi:hypothetical protein